MTQPEALRIAEGLEKYPVTYSPYAAAELRRLHEVNQEMLKALRRITHPAADDTDLEHALSVIALAEAK